MVETILAKNTLCNHLRYFRFTKTCFFLRESFMLTLVCPGVLMHKAKRGVTECCQGGELEKLHKG